MEIIKINNTNELPQDIGFMMYVAEPSPAAAAAAYRQKYGSDPKMVYHRVWPNGRSTVYIPVIPALTVISSHGSIMDHDDQSQKGPG